MVQELASDERLEVAHGCVLALEAESLLHGAGGGEAFVDFVEEDDVVEDLLLLGGGWTGDGVHCCTLPVRFLKSSCVFVFFRSSRRGSVGVEAVSSCSHMTATFHSAGSGPGLPG